MKNQSTELSLHFACADFLELLARRGRINKPGDPYISHIPLGEVRDARTGAKLKRMFTQAGIADFMLLIEGRAIFIELKSTIGKQTPAQGAFEQIVSDLGHGYRIARTLDEFIGILKVYGIEA